MALAAKHVIEHICTPEFGLIARGSRASERSRRNHARISCCVLVVDSLALQLRRNNGQSGGPGRSAGRTHPFGGEECPDGIDARSLPRYPQDALRSRTEGWVVVAVELSSDGQILSRKIDSEKPSGVFSQAALDSVDSNAFSRSSGTRRCKMLYTFGLDG